MRPGKPPQTEPPSTPGVTRGCTEQKNPGWGCPAIPGWAVGVCGLVCVLRLYPAILGWGSWCVGVGWSFGFHSANPGWGVAACVFVCGLRLYLAFPGSAVRCGCARLGSGFQLCLAIPGWGVGLCVLVCAQRLYPANPGSGVQCRCVPGLKFRLRPAIPGWVVGLCVLVCALRLYPANPGWGVRSACVCLGSGFGCAPQFLAGVLGCVFRCVRSACTPPILAGPCDVGVCAWARISAAPRHSWLGCCGVCCWVLAPPVPRQSWLGCAVLVCVLGLGLQLRPAIPRWGVWLCVLVCALCLCPAYPGWGVQYGCMCLGSVFGCTPPFLAGVLGCVCLCVRSACIPPVLPWVCGVGVFAWIRASAVLLHSWLGCPVVCFAVYAPPVPGLPSPGCALWVCALGLGSRLHPAIPGWGIGLSVLVCALHLCPAYPCLGVLGGCVCLGSGLGCA